MAEVTNEDLLAVILDVKTILDECISDLRAITQDADEFNMELKRFGVVRDLSSRSG